MEELEKKDLHVGGYYISNNGIIFKTNDLNKDLNPNLNIKIRSYHNNGSTLGYGLKSPYKKATQQQKEHLDACIAAGKYVDYEYTKEPKFEVGKWYKWYQKDHGAYHYGKMNKFDDKQHFTMKPWICRCKSYQGFGTFLTEKANEITLITDLSEIQQYLPDGHVDKLPVKGETSDNLNVEELIEGETYSGIIKGAGEIIFIPEVCELYSNSISTPINSYAKGNAPDQVRNIRKATDEEKQWLDACIKANKFIPKEKVKEELTELPEKWYVKNDTKESHKVLGKWREAGPCGDMSSGLKPQGYLSYNKGYYYDTLNSIPKDLVEITFEQFKKWVLKDGESKNEKQNDVKEIIPKKGKWYDITAFGGANYIVRYNGNWHYCEYISSNLMYHPSGNFDNVKILRELKAEDPKITESLLEYAKKKYLIGTRVESPDIKGNFYIIDKYHVPFEIFKKEIRSKKNGFAIYNGSGKWAEIISLPEGKVGPSFTDNTSKYKFKVGDSVKIVKHGYGIASSCVGKTVTITKLGKYDGDNGYKISPEIGNSSSSYYKGFNGEESFELVKEESNLEKANRMFKVGMKVKSVYASVFTLTQEDFPLIYFNKDDVGTQSGRYLLYLSTKDKWATIESTSQVDHTETGIQWHEYLFDTGADWKYSGTLDHLGATHPMTTEDYVSKPSSDLIDVEIEVPITIGS